ncbi:hypothetical protein KLPN111888_22520 [Klebsiella pneumoniae]|nr:hypothetical protein IFY67_01847 [Klebsiella pneumoniae]VGP76221.1 hypothetical protein SB00612_04906 [Klebsiella pneumoniae]
MCRTRGRNPDYCICSDVRIKLADINIIIFIQRLPVKTLFPLILFIVTSTVCAKEVKYDFPPDGEMAKSLKPEIVGVANYEMVNRSVRLKALDVGEKDVSILVVIGATDTRKPVTQANIPDKQSISLTKQQIVNKYCAPFGYGNWYFDAFKQRGVKLHYYFYSAVDTPLFTFTVNKSDCD